MASGSGVTTVFRRILRLLFGAALACLLTVAFLVATYRFAPPVSTLMLARAVRGESMDRRYVSLESVSPSLVRAVVLAEDARFCRHHGVDWEALRRVIDAADADGPARGASTIAMQTAKNLFLWPSRSYLRKALEMPLALVLDLVWPKRRILEVYLNIAEWGEGIFGIEAAARHYFGKHADRLDSKEAALLATALPNPVERDPLRPSRGHRTLARRLLAEMQGTAPELFECVQ